VPSTMQVLRRGAAKGVFASIVLITGCATPPQSWPPVPAGSGRIVFYRSENAMFQNLTPSINVDKRAVGRSDVGTKFYVDIQPGAHVVSVPYAPVVTGRGNDGPEGERSLDVTVAAGQTICVRTATGGAAFIGRVEIELIPPEQCTRETARLRAAPDR
jgi:hypothetical protein